MGEPPTLSLVTVTNAGPIAASAFLRRWRPHVHELIVAVDERADPRTPVACAEVADRVLVVPPAHYLERYLGWLHAQATGDWVLRMDDDELPSDALLTALPDLTASRDHTHFWLPCRWLVTPDSYATSDPWASDTHPRLVRNINGLIRATGRLHQELEILGEYRFTDAFYLHTTLITDSAAQRRDRAAAYEQAGSPQLGSGDSVNTIYAPEDRADLTTAPLTASDAARVATFLEELVGDDVPPAMPNPQPPAVTLATIEGHLHEVPTPAHHAARVHIVRPIEPLRCRELRHVMVDVENAGDGVWPAGPDGWPRVRLAHRWWTGADAVDPGTRGYFTERVPPGAVTRVSMPILAPDEPGEYELRIDVLEEFVRWFELADAQPVTVTPAPAGTAEPPPVETKPRFRRRAPDRREVFTNDLRALHDALAPTAFADRYWVWGGLLLGWAREGRLLDHDLYDADFAFIAGDPAFPGAVRALTAAGFTPRRQFVNNDGQVTEWVFERNGAKFEFWALTPRGDHLVYYSYTHGGGELGPPCQAVGRVAAQPRVPFSFLGRRWQKLEDHDRELTGMYGDWRSPNPNWWYMAGALVEREPWYRTECAWDGALAPTEKP